MPDGIPEKSTETLAAATLFQHMCGRTPDSSRYTVPCQSTQRTHEASRAELGDNGRDVRSAHEHPDAREREVNRIPVERVDHATALSGGETHRAAEGAE